MRVRRFSPIQELETKEDMSLFRVTFFADVTLEELGKIRGVSSFELMPVREIDENGNEEA